MFMMCEREAGSFPGCILSLIYFHLEFWVTSDSQLGSDHSSFSMQNNNPKIRLGLNSSTFL